MGLSRHTALRVLLHIPLPTGGTHRVIGVDDFALRRRHRYPTVIIDTETHERINVLPDRTADWLREHPGAEVVCRDGSATYAEAIRRALPDAVQIADRWHLWHNLSESAERAVAQHRACLQVLVPRAREPDPEPAPEEEPSGSPWPMGHRLADRTRSRHAAVHALLRAGHSSHSVQRQLGMTWHTVKRFADAKMPEDLFTGQWRNRTSVLDDYKHPVSPRGGPGRGGHRRLQPPRTRARRSTGAYSQMTYRPSNSPPAQKSKRVPMSVATKPPPSSHWTTVTGGPDKSS